MSRRVVRAEQDTPFGALVLVRGGRATLASEDLANARVVARPSWCRDGDTIAAGQCFTCEMLDNIGTRSLQAMADGPIMDSNRIFLPAGKLTEAEYQERLRLDFERCGIPAIASARMGVR